MSEYTLTIKTTNGSKQIRGKDYFRFMKDYFSLKLLLREWGSYKVAKEKLETHNNMSEQCDFNFGCLCGTLFRVNKNGVDLSHHFEYYDEHNVFYGTYEVV